MINELDYDGMVQDALRDVVRRSLETVAKNGLPGSHHFYVTFRTDYPGVVLPDFLLEKHPEEITIVLQYQFWDLQVFPNHFEVTLSFDESHERIKIPFAALLSFVDPYVKFGVQFSPDYEEFLDEEDLQDDFDLEPAVKAKPTPAKKGKKAKEELLEDDGETKKSDDGSNVISLDSFRKK